MELFFYIIIGIFLAVLIALLSTWLEGVIIRIKQKSPKVIAGSFDTTSDLSSQGEYQYKNRGVKLLILGALLAALLTLYFNLESFLPKSPKTEKLIPATPPPESGNNEIPVEEQPVHDPIPPQDSLINIHDNTQSKNRAEASEIEKIFSEEWVLANKSTRLKEGQSILDKLELKRAGLFKKIIITVESIRKDSVELSITDSLRNGEAFKVQLAAGNTVAKKYDTYGIIITINRISSNADYVILTPRIKYPEKK